LSPFLQIPGKNVSDFFNFMSPQTAQQVTLASLIFFTSFLQMSRTFCDSPTAVPSFHKSKARWSKEEDENLARVVRQRGSSNWNAIAAMLNNRTGKQCRERWLTKLSPTLISEAWTPEEEEALIRLQSLHGNHWAKFRADIPWRSTTSIKNKWVSLQRKKWSESKSVTMINVAGIPAEVPEQSVDLDEFNDAFSFGEFPWCL
jgi:hypothetical protein